MPVWAVVRAARRWDPVGDEVSVAKAIANEPDQEVHWDRLHVAGGAERDVAEPEVCTKLMLAHRARRMHRDSARNCSAEFSALNM